MTEEDNFQTLNINKKISDISEKELNEQENNNRELETNNEVRINSEKVINVNNNNNENPPQLQLMKKIYLCSLLKQLKN